MSSLFAISVMSAVTKLHLYTCYQILGGDHPVTLSVLYRFCSAISGVTQPRYARLLADLHFTVGVS